MAVETLEELRGTIRQLVMDAASMPPDGHMIRANQDSPPPGGGVFYGTYKLTPVRAYGQVRRVREDVPAVDPVPAFAWQDMQETVITQLEVMVSINFFNEGAKEAALQMIQAQFRQPISNYCLKNNIGWRYVSEARDLTALEQAEVQSRYQIDLHLWVQSAISDTIMRAANYSVRIEDENGNTLTELPDGISS